jgi:hypothetical protein
MNPEGTEAWLVPPLSLGSMCDGSNAGNMVRGNWYGLHASKRS